MKGFWDNLAAWAQEAWAWLPWIVGAVAGLFGITSNAISIWEAKTFRHFIKEWHNRRRAVRILRLRRELQDAEDQSEF